MKFGKIPKEKRKFICDKLIPEPYLSRTCSVHSSVRGTSERRNHGLGTEQVHPGYNADKTEPIGKGKIIIYAKRRKLTQKSHGPDG